MKIVTLCDLLSNISADGNLSCLVVCVASVLTGSQTVAKKTLRSEADKHPFKTTEIFQPASKKHQTLLRFDVCDVYRRRAATQKYCCIQM